MNILLDGKEYSTEELIAAIQVSDNIAGGQCTMTLEEVNGVMQSLLLRVAALESLMHDRLLWQHDAGHAVATQSTSEGVEHTVHVTDNLGRKQILKYTIPHDNTTS